MDNEMEEFNQEQVNFTLTRGEDTKIRTLFVNLVKPVEWNLSNGNRTIIVVYFKADQELSSCSLLAVRSQFFVTRVWFLDTADQKYSRFILIGKILSNLAN